jgi:hypothetical protein
VVCQVLVAGLDHSFYGNKIFKSIDGGASWSNLTTVPLTGISLADMAHQLGTDGRIYLNGDFGLA